MTWHRADGHLASGKHVHIGKKIDIPLKRWTETNAAAAVMLTIAQSGNERAFTKALAACPQAFASVAKPARPMATATVVGGVINATLREATTPPVDDDALVLDALGTLVQQYLATAAGSDDERLKAAIVSLSEELSKAQRDLTPEEKGALFGIILAGGLKHAYAITSKDVRRRWIVMTVCNMLWATTSFPFPPPWSGVAAVAIVSAQAAFDYAFPARDFSEALTKLQGAIEVAQLEHRDEASLRTLAWLQTTLKCNGKR